jgi:protein ImuA
MKTEAEKRELVQMFQAKINAMQSLGRVSSEVATDLFFPFSEAFPNHTFPVGALHEFSSYEAVSAASTGGFIASLTGKLIKNDGICLWVSREKKVFPPGLKQFGLTPDRIIFITTSNQKELLWIIEEALKCESLTAVIGEIKQLTFTESRKLQLAVERSGVTGFIHRFMPSGENAVACTARWKITPLQSDIDDDLPGVGYPYWDIQLLKVKNGKPDSWQIGWRNGQFQAISEENLPISINERHAG